MSILSNREFELMKYFKKGNEVTKENRELAYHLASMKFLEIGYDDEHGRFEERAWLTAWGKRILRRETIMRSRVLNFFRQLWAPFFGFDVF